jgi:NAD(P)H-hydrate epimerase
MNDRGSASLAKGGSGDVLAGLVAGLASSGYTALNAGLLGAYLLGRAGELYEEKRGNESALASEIVNLTGDVFKELSSGIHSSSFKTY